MSPSKLATFSKINTIQAIALPRQGFLALLTSLRGDYDTHLPPLPLIG
ncbi:hypothetical protein QUF64_08775 [Anaerolineales bacterium HSG6]|nr:hypothetical protein [Anaerolineales bacterium HSG6]MDM8527272.1 hypothetical protein [Anaerolineales bacterium HSG24]MDM8530181.1 hypothetical protein [Anaerolineales bacterium HSG25]